ncbi:MAG: RNA-binding S4 domain-containing protein [Bacteroidota bacterium]
MSVGVRIDKWLWAVRIFKSRNLATDFCKRSRVIISGDPVKASRLIRIGDKIEIRRPPMILTYQVTGLIEKRVSATIAAENVINLTPPEELEKYKTIHESAFYSRDRGAGRPTKKDRRDIEKISF